MNFMIWQDFIELPGCTPIPYSGFLWLRLILLPFFEIFDSVPVKSACLGPSLTVTTDTTHDAQPLTNDIGTGRLKDGTNVERMTMVP